MMISKMHQCYFEKLERGTVGIELYVNNICQYKCPFCFVRAWRQPKAFISKDRLHYLFDVFKTIPKIHLVILGGEPTLYPYLQEILLLPYPKTLISNGHKDLGQYQYVKTDFQLSYYPKITCEVNFYRNLANEDIARNATVLLAQKGKSPECDRLVQYCSDHGIPLKDSPLVLKNRVLNSNTYTETDEFFILDGKRYTHFEMLDGRNNFKGWTCELSFIQIDVFGNVMKGCRQAGNIYEDKNILMHYKPELVKCTSERCFTDSWLGQFKYS